MKGVPIYKDEFFALETTVVIPAALEMQIGEEEAKHMKCDVIVEGANGPLTDKADGEIETNIVLGAWCCQ